MLIGLLSACSTVRLTFCRSLVPDGIRCISLNNQPGKARPVLTDLNQNEPLCYPFTVSVNNCGGNFTTIDDPYAGICVLNEVKNMNVKLFNLRSRLNETKSLFPLESYECKRKLN